MQSDSAPPTSGESTMPATGRAEDVNDPVRLLLAEPAARGVRFQARHWSGFAVLVITVVAAAIVVPLLINPQHPKQNAASAPVITGTAAQPVGATVVLGPSATSAPVTVSAPASAGSTMAPTAAQPATTTNAATGPATAGAAPDPATTTPARPGATTPPEPAGFTAITVQAEQATLSDGASIVSCGTCEGGARVRYLGRLETTVTVATAGERTLTVTYEVSGARKLNVTVNGVAALADTRLSGTSWDTPQQFSTDVAVPAGAVTIAVFGDSNAPDVDAITIS